MDQSIKEWAKDGTVFLTGAIANVCRKAGGDGFGETLEGYTRSSRAATKTLVSL